MQRIPPALLGDSDADDVEWQRKSEAKRTRMRKAPGVAQGIADLARKGADRDKLLTLLVISCPTRSPELMREGRNSESWACVLWRKIWN